MKLVHINLSTASIFLSLVCILSLHAQKVPVYPEFSISSSTLEQHLRFLASDELRGRRTGTEGSAAAARYIAEQFRMYGVKVIPGQDDYFQPVRLLRNIPGGGGSVNVAQHSYTHGDSMLWLSGAAVQFEVEAVWLGHGWVDEERGYNDYQNKEVKGKVVIVASGVPGSQSRTEAVRAMPLKRKWASERGAIALIELYQLNTPWNFFKNYVSKERLDLLDEDALPQELDSIPYGWVFAAHADWVREIQKGGTAIVSVQSVGNRSEIITSNNVAGVIEGSDPNLKEEYVLLSAHYDHVGVGAQGGRYTEEDSIFNGARDNGMGTVALLAAAQSLAKLPARRSVILLALTAEEIGLLGSAHYASNPLIPLEQTIFNLNNDGAGYTDTGAVAIIGYDRVGVADIFDKATQKLGLKIYPDPAKEQNLFDRSDNVSFAKKGVPAPTFSPGFEQFNAEMFKYYHQVSDEVESIDWNYLKRFAQAYTYAARLIANRDERPFWVKGDKYEEAGKKLYGQ